MTERILKWDVPVDDAEHLIGWGHVLSVGCQYEPDTVQVWTLEDCSDGPPEPRRPVRVFGTGQPLPDSVEHLGTALVAGKPLVWHLLAIGEGAGIDPQESSFYSTTVTTPEGTFIASLIVDTVVRGDDYQSVVESGAKHMAWIVGNGLERGD